MRGEVLNQWWGEAEVVSRFGEYISEELQGGCCPLGGEGRGGFCEAGGAGSGDGSRQLLIARGDGGDFRHRTGWWLRRGRVSRKLDGRMQKKYNVGGGR